MSTAPRLTCQHDANLDGDEHHELLDGEAVLLPAPNENTRIRTMLRSALGRSNLVNTTSHC